MQDETNKMVMEIEEAVKVLTDEGYIKWCQNKPLEPGDYKEGKRENDK